MGDRDQRAACGSWRGFGPGAVHAGFTADSGITEEDIDDLLMGVSG